MWYRDVLETVPLVLRYIARSDKSRSCLYGTDPVTACQVQGLPRHFCAQTCLQLSAAAANPLHTPMCFTIQPNQN